jgi:hypothetical protein
VTTASEPKSASPQRARERWRKRTEAAEMAPDGTEISTPEPETPVVAETPPLPATARPGAKEFVLENLRVLGAVILLIVGIVFVILGWYGAANTNILTEQIPYLISGGLLGVALIIVAGFLGSSASLERENRELRRDLMRAMSSMGSMGGRAEIRSGNPSGDGQVFVVSGGRSYHFAGCPIVEGKESSALAVGEALRSGYESCKLCGLE